MNHLIELPNRFNKTVEIIQLLYLSEIIKFIHPGDTNFMDYKQESMGFAAFESTYMYIQDKTTRQDKVIESTPIPC
jgi:hypothetical protein